MITCNFKGELGNNLFQLAAMIAHADNVDDSFGIINDRDCYISIDDRPIEIEQMFDYVFLETDAKHKQLYLAPDIHGEPRNFGYTQIPSSPDICLTGYFQSEKYFEFISEELRNEYFKPSTLVMDTIHDKYEHLLNLNTVSFHVRKGGDREALAYEFGDINPVYYGNALNLILERDPFVERVLIFSDDIEWCKKYFDHEDHIEFIEDNPNYIDMFLMSMCNHNVIANSSFSWWAAWLNQNPEKIVVAPANEWFGPGLRHLYLGDLFPDTWLKL